MTKPQALTIFSGGGLASIGLMQAGFDCIAGVEFNPNPTYGHPDVIAKWYSKNLHGEMICQSVIDVDFKRFKGVDLVQASLLPCILRSKK